MKFPKILLCAGFLLGAHALCAQEENRHYSLALQWGVYIPSDGGFLNHAAAVSPSLEWDWRISNTFSVGAAAGYIRGSEQGFTQDRYEGDLVTGTSDRKLTLVPLTVHLRWIPVTFLQQRLQPFVGAGIGAQYAGFRIGGDLINKSQVDSWGAVVRPEAGIGFSPRQNGRICIEVKCGWQYAANKFPVMHMQSLRGVQVSAGIRYRF